LVARNSAGTKLAVFAVISGFGPANAHLRPASPRVRMSARRPSRGPVRHSASDEARRKAGLRIAPGVSVTPSRAQSAGRYQEPGDDYATSQVIRRLRKEARLRCNRSGLADFHHSLVTIVHPEHLLDGA